MESLVSIYTGNDPEVDKSDATAQFVRAGALLNQADKLLTSKEPNDLGYEERELASYITQVADVRVQLGRALLGR